MSSRFPLTANKELHFIFSGEKVLWKGGFPKGIKAAIHLLGPGIGFKVDKIAIAEPKHSPLRAGSHAVVNEHREHAPDGIAPRNARVARQ